MRISRVYIEDFKNLKQFEIELDKDQMKTVLLGQNATGKSNFIESLVLIFKYLDLSKDDKRRYPKFKYSISYTIGRNEIEITYDGSSYLIHVNSEKISSYKSFFSSEGKKLYQPRYVFTYYSGLSNRLKEHFWEHQENFYERIIKKGFKDDELDSLRKLFYVQLVHSYFVLLAYFSFEEEEQESIEFLSEILHIKDIESILFVLKMPKWANSRNNKYIDKFWTAEGLVRNFLELLWKYSLAPIYNDEKIKVDFKNEEPQKRLYLFISNKEKLKELAQHYKSNTEFFKALESTYISKMISEVRIKVKKENVDGSITFKELSEGEQQLLTVLGLLKFTKDENSLILLDEPDTHLNPIWKWKYFEFLDKVVNNHKTTQIIMNTHDPLVIGNLTKEEVRIFRNEDGKIITEMPEIDPQGLGVEGILTSELFGLPTTLDDETIKKLEERNDLLVKQQNGELKENEDIRLKDLFNELEELGFSKTFRDPLYQKFIIAYTERIKSLKSKEFSKSDLNFQNDLALEILEELKKEDEE